ncbi:MAG: UbiA-like polyprenyltransferase [Acidobacteriota bacterium]|nr:putative 4-hydroxybenzoate polyprenyltransferase [Blastocatellia bacterium]MDW8241268.1 UbiA-like polyprenyltransferase [Acidobacteriota bacterium]
MSSLIRSTRITLEMIKIEHSLFALPFALLGALLAAGGLPSLPVIFWIVVAMVGARSSAMAFNRLVDRQYDGQNPRTKNRAIPAGLVSVGYVKVFVIVSALVFILAAAMLNRLALYLSPVALASILLYSYAKRYTAYTHLLIGWCLAIAPAGAWIAVRGRLDSPIPWFLSLAVLTWTAGFDIIYSCQDVAFDRQVGLRSLPVRYGINRALWIARALHVVTFVSLVAVAWLSGMKTLGVLGLMATAALLVRQHAIVKPHDLSRVDQAFFTTNAYISVILFLTMGADILWRSLQ